MGDFAAQQERANSHSGELAEEVDVLVLGVETTKHALHEQAGQ